MLTCRNLGSSLAKSWSGVDGCLVHECWKFLLCRKFIGLKDPMASAYFVFWILSAKNKTAKRKGSAKKFRRLINTQFALLNIFPLRIDFLQLLSYSRIAYKMFTTNQTKNNFLLWILTLSATHNITPAWLQAICIYFVPRSTSWLKMYLTTSRGWNFASKNVYGLPNTVEPR